MDTWIIGKNASILTFPEGFFDDKLTIGINEAAIDFKTKFAFSCYPMHIKEFIQAGYPLSKIIGVKPAVKPEGQWAADNYPNYFPGILNDPIYYHNTVRYQRNQIEEEMKQLLLLNRDIPYHNNGTSLQMLIYWCVLHGRVPMRVVGCNQDTKCSKKCNDKNCDRKYDGFCVPKDIWEDSRLYTEEVIRCLNLHGGDIVRFYRNYEECVKGES